MFSTGVRVLRGQQRRPVRRQFALPVPVEERVKQPHAQRPAQPERPPAQLQQQARQKLRDLPVQHMAGLDMPQFMPQDHAPLVLVQQIQQPRIEHNDRRFDAERDGIGKGPLVNVQLRHRHVQNSQHSTSILCRSGH